MFFARAKIIALITLMTLIVAGSALALENPPNISVKALDGQNIDIASHKDQVVYVDFWATWCPPCRKSFPWMERMHQKYEALGLKIIAISIDGKRESIGTFLKATPVTFTIAHDPGGKSAEAFKVTGMPSSYIIDRQGKLHSTHIGFRSSDKEKLEAIFKLLLAQ